MRYDMYNKNMKNKKILYLIPLILVILFFTPFAIYKDSVDMINFSNLTPSHWRYLEIDISTQANESRSWVILGTTKPVQNSEPLTKNANFLGFPFASYFSVYEVTDESYSRVSGFSWLWTVINLSFIIGSIIIVRKIIKKK